MMRRTRLFLRAGKGQSIAFPLMQHTIVVVVLIMSSPNDTSVYCSKMMLNSARYSSSTRRAAKHTPLLPRIKSTAFKVSTIRINKCFFTSDMIIQLACQKTHSIITFFYTGTKKKPLHKAQNLAERLVYLVQPYRTTCSCCVSRTSSPTRKTSEYVPIGSPARLYACVCAPPDCTALTIRRTS